MRHPRPATMAIALLTLLPLAACAPSGGVPTPSPTSTLASPSATPTPTPSPSEPARHTAAKDTVVRWFQTTDSLGQSPDLPLDELLKVSRGTAYETWGQAFQVRRVSGYKQVGNTILISLAAQDADPIEGRKVVKVAACYDVSKVNVVDATGSSVVSPDRVPRAKAEFTVAQYTDGWFVVDDVTKGEPC